MGKTSFVMPKNYADLGRVLLASRRAFLMAGLFENYLLFVGREGGVAGIS